MNKSIIDYLFKSNNNRDGTTDQTSLLIKPLKESIGTKIKDEEKVFGTKSNESLSLHEYKIDVELEAINKILQNTENIGTELNEKVRERLVDLKLKALETEKRVKEALLSERKLAGESYTVNIPLKKEYITDNTTAVVDNNIVFGTGYLDENATEVHSLNALNLISEEDTVFHISSNKSVFPIKLELENNLYKSYNQIKIKVEDKAQTGVLYISFKNAEAVSVLNEEGYEIVEPKIAKNLALPLNVDTKSFSIRFANNSKRTVTIDKLYFTTALYNKETLFETVPINITKDLSYFTLQTCDNFSNPDVSLEYSVSINDSRYKVIRPNGKLSVSGFLDSVFRASETSDSITIETSGLENNKYKFINKEINSLNADFNIFSKKFDKDFYSFENYIKDSEKDYTLYSYNKEEFTLKLSEGMSITVNDIYYTYNSKNEGEVSIPKGLSKLKIKKEFWKEIVDLDKYQITGITETMLTVIDRNNDTVVEVDNYFNTDSKLNNSLFLQLYQNNTTMYLVKETDIIKTKDSNYDDCFYKDNNNPIYVHSDAYITTVDKIQIRVAMKSISNNTCPFISRILLRGI